ncbi:hypothetical protein PtA15_13A338 [Puccinia triticina]|uniref:Secreted protein n=1 Tax=Puccinia triticina TaxID=208348 RepID=A0ABY7D039_9BASI|nr:uncharacterized protein PtA15_13A338 [Puccinia triticina]WAQ90938.1 hypothetical protein PtA15_13A338 [Puccinia triticina]
MKLVYYTTSVLVLLIAMLHVNLVSSSPVTDEVSTIGSQGETQGNTRLNPEARPTEKPRRRAVKTHTYGGIKVFQNKGSGSSTTQNSPHKVPQDPRIKIDQNNARARRLAPNKSTCLGFIKW